MFWHIACCVCLCVCLGVILWVGLSRELLGQRRDFFVLPVTGHPQQYGTQPGGDVKRGPPSSTSSSSSSDPSVPPTPTDPPTRLLQGQLQHDPSLPHPSLPPSLSSSLPFLHVTSSSHRLNYREESVFFVLLFLFLFPDMSDEERRKHRLTPIFFLPFWSFHWEKKNKKLSRTILLHDLTRREKMYRRTSRWIYYYNRTSPLFSEQKKKKKKLEGKKTFPRFRYWRGGHLCDFIVIILCLVFFNMRTCFLIHLLRLSSPVGLLVLKRSEHDNLQTIRVVKKKKKKKKENKKTTNFILRAGNRLFELLEQKK